MDIRGYAGSNCFEAPGEKTLKGELESGGPRRPNSSTHKEPSSLCLSEEALIGSDGAKMLQKALDALAHASRTRKHLLVSGSSPRGFSALAEILGAMFNPETCES